MLQLNKNKKSCISHVESFYWTRKIYVECSVCYTVTQNNFLKSPMRTVHFWNHLMWNSTDWLAYKFPWLIRSMLNAFIPKSFCLWIILWISITFVEININFFSGKFFQIIHQLSTSWVTLSVEETPVKMLCSVSKEWIFLVPD